MVFAGSVRPCGLAREWREKERVTTSNGRTKYQADVMGGISRDADSLAVYGDGCCADGRAIHYGCDYETSRLTQRRFGLATVTGCPQYWGIKEE